MKTTTEPLQDLEILILEDERTISTLYHRILERTGVKNQKRFFEKRELAREYILENGQQVPFLIILDLSHPEMGGWELLEELEAHAKNFKVYVMIVATSVQNSDFKKAFGFSSVIGFHQKPLYLDEVQMSLLDERIRPYMLIDKE